MPTQNQHRTKARGNRDFLREIDPAARADWAVTVAFYTAVHLVEEVRAIRDLRVVAAGVCRDGRRWKCVLLAVGAAGHERRSIEAVRVEVGIFE